MRPSMSGKPTSREGREKRDTRLSSRQDDRTTCRHEPRLSGPVYGDTVNVALTMAVPV